MELTSDEQPRQDESWLERLNRLADQLMYSPELAEDPRFRKEVRVSESEIWAHIRRTAEGLSSTHLTNYLDDVLFELRIKMTSDEGRFVSGMLLDRVVQLHERLSQGVFPEHRGIGGYRAPEHFRRTVKLLNDNPGLRTWEEFYNEADRIGDEEQLPYQNLGDAMRKALGRRLGDHGISWEGGFDGFKNKILELHDKFGQLDD